MRNYLEKHGHHIATRYAASILVASIFFSSVQCPSLAEPIGEHVAKSTLLAAGVAAPAMVRQTSLAKGTVARAGQKKARASKRQTAQKPVDFMQRGFYFKQRGDLNRALVEFLKASQHNPRLLKAFYEQAVIFRQRGMRKLAESALEQGLAVANNLIDAGNGANAGGKKNARPSAPSAEECQQLRLLLATVRLEQGNLGGAMQELTRTLGLEVQPASEEKDSPRTVLQSIHRSVAGLVDDTVTGGKAEGAGSNSSDKVSSCGSGTCEQSDSAQSGSHSASSREQGGAALKEDHRRGGMLWQLFSFHLNGLPGIPDLNFLIRKKGKLQQTKRKKRTIIDRWFPPEVKDVPDLEAQSRIASADASAPEKKLPKEKDIPAAVHADDRTSKEEVASGSIDIVATTVKESPEVLSKEGSAALSKERSAALSKEDSVVTDNEVAGHSSTNDSEAKAGEKSPDDGRLASSLDFAPSGKWRKVEIANRNEKSGSPFAIPEVFKSGTIASTLTQSAKSLLDSLTAKNEESSSGEDGTSCDRKGGILPVQPEDDEATKRLKHLAENGTSSLKEGEAFMFSEETGEATLFANGKVVRRQIAVPRDSAEVVAERRPDILIPENLMYNISLLARLMPKQDEAAPAHQAESGAKQVEQPTFNTPNMLGQSQVFFDWLKQLLGVR